MTKKQSSSFPENSKRTNDKRYQEKKRRAQEKLAGVTAIKPVITWDSPEIPHLPKGEESGTVSWFRSSKEGRIIEILEPRSGLTLDCAIDPRLPVELVRDLVVGDKVTFVKNDPICSLISRENRENFLARFRGDANRPTLAKRERHVIAANIDYAVIVAASKNPSFHPSLIDRYLVLCQNGWVAPLVCITKCDLGEPSHPALAWYGELGIKVIMTSTLTGKWLDELKSALSGKTCVLVGNSGVWKSTITNALLWAEMERTSDVGKKTWQGRHTTTASHVYQWLDHSFIIDTPGIRSLDIFEIPKNELRLYFSEFSTYSDSCQYSDCSHIHEPECGVKSAVSVGLINKGRYASYLRMHGDLV